MEATLVTCAEGWGSSAPPHTGQSTFTKPDSRTFGAARLTLDVFRVASSTAMSLIQQLPRARPFVCRQCVRKERLALGGLRHKGTWAHKAENPEHEARQWEDRGYRIKNGDEKSMIQILEERGFVKDIAGCVLLF